MLPISRIFRTITRAVAVSALVGVLVGCSSSTPTGVTDADGSEPGTDGPAATSAAVSLPPAGAAFDYQLGTAYDPPDGVSVVERDRTAEPTARGFDICYVNGFQTQPSESAQMAKDHPDLLLQTDDGPLVDPGWPDEFLFDMSTAAKRDRLVGLVTPWIDGCADAGFDAVEIDNLDSYTRSDGKLSLEDSLALAASYAEAAHNVGLAIAQKNTADQTRALKDLGYDFAVSESCWKFEECSDYTDVYPVVLDIEYSDELGRDGFDDACADSSHPASMILRDPTLVGPADDGYVFERCGLQ